jgi:hypothetical protein
MAFDSPSPADPSPEHGDAPPSGYALLARQYLISLSEPVPSMAGPTFEAFKASDRRHPGPAYVALVCSGEVVPRLSSLSAMKGLSGSGLLSLVASGPVDWPDGRQRMVALYTSPLGGRFALTAPFQPHQIIDMLLRPATAALKEIHARGTTHRAIRPDNLYLKDAGAQTLALGPSVVVPPGFGQPDIYEPLETAAADPTGRGPGTSKHDMFALGMTAVALLLGRQPGTGVERDELMIRRLEYGSLSAVVDRHMVPRELIDAFYGLLTDDESDRWSAADLDKWLHAGRPDTPHLPELQRAITPYTISGRQVRSARSLAYVLGRNWKDGARQLRSEALHNWVKDYMPERMAAAMLDQALLETDPQGDDGDALLVSRAVMALDPQGPARYRDAVVDPYGLGPFLFDAAKTPERRANALGLLNYGVPQKVLERRPSERRPNARRATRQAINFERLRRWATSTLPGEGLERCLYDLNDALPCLSPLVGGRWVANAADLVAALDTAVLSGKLAEPAMDEALATFIATRMSADPEALMALQKPDEADEVAMLAAIRFLAELQQSLGSPPLRGIASWCANLARRIAESVHHRPTRKLLHEGIDRALPQGSAAQILKLVDIPELKPRDSLGFASAKARWSQREFEIRALQNNLEMRRERAWRRGRDNVSLAAGAVALIFLFLTLIVDPGS